MWEPKMCRLAWQLLGMLGNVLGLLGMLRNVLGMPWQRPRHACNVLGLLGMLPARSQESHIEDKTPHLLLYKGAWWYTTPLASQLIRKQVGGFIFDVGLLGPCGKHAEEHAQDVAKACLGRCEACQGGRGRCQASLGVAKQAYTSQVPTYNITHVTVKMRCGAVMVLVKF